MTRRSSSSSSSSSGRSSRSSTSSVSVNVPSWKGMKTVLWLAGGDPFRHTNFRRETIPRSSGSHKTTERLVMVRDPSGYTPYFYEDDTASHYSSGGSRSGRRSSQSRSHRSHASSSTRAPSAMGGVPPMPQPPPPHMPGGGPWMSGPQGPPGGGMPPPMGMGMGMGMGPPPPMMGGGGHPPSMHSGYPEDDDMESLYSGSGSSGSYMSDEGDGFDQPMGGMPMPMPPMQPMHQQMPPMMHQQMPPMQPPQDGGFGPGGPGFIQIG